MRAATRMPLLACLFDRSNLDADGPPRSIAGGTCRSWAARSVSPLAADHWPQWRGPTLNGVSARKPAGPLVDDRERHLEAAMPSGPDRRRSSGATDLSSTSAKDRPPRALGVDRTNGTVRWKRPLGGGNRRMMKQQMSSPSPVTDGKTVWVMTGTGV